MVSVQDMGVNLKANLQIKMLNVKKGPGVRSLRAQGCKVNYPKEMLNRLNSLKNLTIKEDTVKELILENKKVIGVLTETGEKIYKYFKKKVQKIKKCT